PIGRRLLVRLPAEGSREPGSGRVVLFPSARIPAELGSRRRVTRSCNFGDDAIEHFASEDGARFETKKVGNGCEIDAAAVVTFASPRKHDLFGFRELSLLDQDK